MAGRPWRPRLKQPQLGACTPSLLHALPPHPALQVLPERIPGQRGMSVLLDSEGHAAPGSSAPLAAEQSVQLSAAFTSGGAPGNLSGLASEHTALPARLSWCTALPSMLALTKHMCVSALLSTTPAHALPNYLPACSPSVPQAMR